uniref:Leucine-rich repeat-containing N-terminal plant-type domain-containing protein n=2 Tax=Chenopodium quinoa TaxID=63459 RepID=A0A803MA32_CHEQI
MNYTLPKKTSLLCFCIYLFISSGKSIQSPSICHPNDQKVLLQIKNHFHNASCFATWMPDSDCCSWSGIKCDDNDSNPGRVTVFRIGANAVNCISGQIPPMLGDLPFLRKLTLNFQDNLTGSIPLRLSKLTRLECLHLCCNNLTGPIPSFWGPEFESLHLLGLHLNYFTGTIPSSLSLLPNITSLALFSNLLTGSIPESFGSFKTNLSLTLLNNKLSGPIPRSLGQANFTIIDLSYNQFSGDASFLFARDKPLQRISLRQNKFKFDFTNINLPKGLRSLDIADNEIYGSFPKRLGLLQPKFNDVSNNNLCGRIPTSRRLIRFDTSDLVRNNECLGDILLPPCKMLMCDEKQILEF